MKNQIKNVIRNLGYELRRIQHHSNGSAGFKLFEYRKSDGSFDYEKYRKTQQDGNLKKIELTWVIEGNIKFLSDYLTEFNDPTSFGICHGTRRGNEQKWFRQYLSCEVIGTEISDSASQFPNTIQWDFHQANPEWEGKADFIYSNSFDHSYDPEACLNTWIDSLRIGGLCILEHSNLHAPEGANELDPFGAEIELMPFLITKWTKGRFFVREILDAPEKNPSLKSLQFIVIERRK
jgi:hypothetical protein